MRLEVLFKTTILKLAMQAISISLILNFLRFENETPIGSRKNV